MSQAIIYDILKELGGTGTSSQIREIVAARYPNKTLYEYVATRLRALEKRKKIKLIKKDKSKKNSIFICQII